jgi:hypothetical protein
MKKRLQIISYFAFAMLTNEVQIQSFEAGLTYSMTYKNVIALKSGADESPDYPDDTGGFMGLGTYHI